MKTYQYTSPENTVVHVFDEDGISRMSMLSSLVPEGEHIVPYVAPPTLAEPTVRCTRRQGRLALLQAGLLFQVEAMIAGIPDDLARTQAQIEYETDTWEADNATLQAMWEALGKTPDELAEFFALAAQL